MLKSEGSSITEGIGQGRITKNLEGLKPDFSYNIKDDEALNIIYSLIIEEGLSLGTSSGINICGAIKMAKELGPVTTSLQYSVIIAKDINPNFLTLNFSKEKIYLFPFGLKTKITNCQTFL